MTHQRHPWDAWNWVRLNSSASYTVQMERLFNCLLRYPQTQTNTLVHQRLFLRVCVWGFVPEALICCLFKWRSVRQKSFFSRSALICLRLLDCEYITLIYWWAVKILPSHRLNLWLNTWLSPPLLKPGCVRCEVDSSPEHSGAFFSCPSGNESEVYLFIYSSIWIIHNIIYRPGV